MKEPFGIYLESRRYLIECYAYMGKLSVAQEVYEKNLKSVDEKYQLFGKIGEILLRYYSKEMVECYEK
jgi:hypothetical protein